MTSGRTAGVGCCFFELRLAMRLSTQYSVDGLR
jgi:hypothetical protein